MFAQLNSFAMLHFLPLLLYKVMLCVEGGDNTELESQRGTVVKTIAAHPLWHR